MYYFLLLFSGLCFDVNFFKDSEIPVLGFVSEISIEFYFSCLSSNIANALSFLHT